MRKNELLPKILIILMGLAFSFSLFYLTLELYNILNFLLNPIFSFHYLLIPLEFRIIGLICFFVIISLITLGFIIKKLKISTIGSFILFLPTFGHFFMAMFLLIGIQGLQLILLPFIASGILSFGSIIKLPYIFINFMASFSTVKILLIYGIIYGIIFIGLLIFSIGVINWLRGVIKKKDLIDFSIYKYIRHPQYLGYLIWSYGVYLLTLIPLAATPHGYISFDYTFIWLLSALAIIGIALYEEILMKEKFPEKYPKYQKRTSFLIPIPKFLQSIITRPIRLLFKKELPESRKEILFLLFFYGALIILISLLFDPFLLII